LLARLSQLEQHSEDASGYIERLEGKVTKLKNTNKRLHKEIAKKNWQIEAAFDTTVGLLIARVKASSLKDLSDSSKCRNEIAQSFLSDPPSYCESPDLSVEKCQQPDPRNSD